MFRFLIDVFGFFLLAMAARAFFRSVMKNFANAARSGFQAQQANQEPKAQEPKERVTVAGELHKDPVCGMYVAESTAYQRKSGREVFYYCSEKCKEEHAVAAKA